jgi:hypothetical protein
MSSFCGHGSMGCGPLGIEYSLVHGSKCFRWNVGKYLQEYMASQPRRPQSTNKLVCRFLILNGILQWLSGIPQFNVIPTVKGKSVDMHNPSIFQLA